MKQCAYCPELLNTVDCFIKHLKKFHSNETNLIIPCGSEDCSKTFRSFGSRTTHRYRSHKGSNSFKSNSFENTTNSNPKVPNSNLSIQHQETQEKMFVDCEEETSETFTPPLKTSTEKIENSTDNTEKLSKAQFIVNLRRKNIPENDIKKIVEEAEILMRTAVDNFHKKIDEELSRKGIRLHNYFDISQTTDGRCKSVTSLAKNIDCRNVKRGVCWNNNCDCDGYEREEGKSSCFYCSCPPTKHYRLEGDDNATLLSTSSKTCTDVLTDNFQHFESVYLDDDILSKLNASKPSNSMGQSIPVNGIVVDSLLECDLNTLPESPSLNISEVFSLNSIPRSNSAAPNFTLPNLTTSNSTASSLTTSNPTASNLTRSNPTASNLTRSNLTASNLTTSNLTASNLTTSKSTTLHSTASKLRTPNVRLSSSSSQNRIDACFPEEWPTFVNGALNSNETVPSIVRCHIIRTIVRHMTERKTTDHHDFIEVAEELLKRMPCLRLNSATSIPVLVGELKKRYKNQIQYEKQRFKNHDSETKKQKTFEELKLLMQQEILKSNPSTDSLKKCLEACRVKRKDEARKIRSPKQHLKDYPALSKPDLLKWEFECEIGLRSCIIMTNWINSIPKMMAYFLPNAKMDSLTNNQMTVLILQELSNHFKHKSLAENNSTKNILQIFKAETKIADVKPKEDEPPRLIGIASNDFADLTFSLYIDEQPLFCGDAIDALIQMFAMYWVFEIEYPAEAKISYTFVAAVLLQKKTMQHYSKYKCLLNVLEKLQLF